MESTSSQEQKYQKLASEYSKIRAQANVLKRAVIEEQNKNSLLRETLRLKETSLRRAEQEVDSLGFRNKQLEHRVESLQEDLNGELKKSKGNKGNTKASRNNNESVDINDPVLTEEFQKKIIENAQLASLIADKESELILFKNRVTDLERQLTVRDSNNSEIEKKLRKEIEILSAKNSELETKVAEAASMLGSEDGLSVTGSDNTPIHANTSTSSEERISFLEKELNNWRLQYEILKLNDTVVLDKTTNHQKLTLNGSNYSKENNIEETNDLDIPKQNLTNEQLIYNHFNKKFEKILNEKFLAESKIRNYLIECEQLQNNMEILTNQIQQYEFELKESRRKIQLSDDDLTTTRLNYDEQISVLTEQVISLSDQLASLK